jgi:hypothetical protein
MFAVETLASVKEALRIVRGSDGLFFQYVGNVPT